MGRPGRIQVSLPVSLFVVIAVAAAINGNTGLVPEHLAIIFFTDLVTQMRIEFITVIPTVIQISISVLRIIA